jgi:hypothetical protein
MVLFEPFEIPQPVLNLIQYQVRNDVNWFLKDIPNR